MLKSYQGSVEYLRMMILQSNVLLASISGGTDIIACFMGENSVLPVYRGEIQSPHLGCDIEVGGCCVKMCKQLPRKYR